MLREIYSSKDFLGFQGCKNDLKLPKSAPKHKRGEADSTRKLIVPLALWFPPFIDICLDKHGG